MMDNFWWRHNIPFGIEIEKVNHLKMKVVIFHEEISLYHIFKVYKWLCRVKFYILVKIDRY